MKSLDLTPILEKKFGKKIFFNLSMALITGNLYLCCARTYTYDPNKPLDNNKNPYKNKQHPWNHNWVPLKTSIDKTIYFIFDYEKEEIVGNGKYAEGHDTRLFRFYEDDKVINYISTFNKIFLGETIKLKQSNCKDYCYIIGWNFIILDKQSLEYKIIDSASPICNEISERVEKNWSLWNYTEKNIIYPMFSYMLVPNHSAFLWKISELNANLVKSKKQCDLLTHDYKHNIYKNLEKLYPKNLFVSLSTPCYPFNDSGTEYLGVGHIKVKRSYFDKVFDSELKDFIDEMPEDDELENRNFIYFQFFYTFKIQILDPKNPNVEKIRPNSYNLNVGNIRLKAPIEKTSNAFIVKDHYRYYLNFPSGLVIKDGKVFVSYGIGDILCYISEFSMEEVNKMLIPVDEISADDFKFEII